VRKSNFTARSARGAEGAEGVCFLTCRETTASQKKISSAIRRLNQSARVLFICRYLPRTDQRDVPPANGKSVHSALSAPLAKRAVKILEE
jgi:hypothetical protein